MVDGRGVGCGVDGVEGRGLGLVGRGRKGGDARLKRGLGGKRRRGLG